jgi:hypothetical protein
MAEGLIEKLDPKELVELQDVERDEHGHIRLAEVDLARKIKVEVQGRFSERGIRVTLANKQIGYELRCADPIAFDAAYCRDLGTPPYASPRVATARWCPSGWAYGAFDSRRCVRQERVRNVDIGRRVSGGARIHAAPEPEDFRDAAGWRRLRPPASAASAARALRVPSQ